MNDEDYALMVHVDESTPEQLADELKALRNGLHDCKEVCNNARLRLPQALEEIEQAMERVGQPHEVGGPLARAFEAVTLTLAAMKGVPENKVSEKQVVQYLKDYAAENDIEHVSIQYTATDKKFPDSRENLFFYCNNRGHSGQSTRSIKEANTRLVEQMDKQGANR